MELNKYIDHTLLKPDATLHQISILCDEALQFQFYSVCVNSSYVSFCAERLKNSDVKVCSVVGFPLGSMDSETKAFETRNAVNNGAQEIDMVIHVGSLKDKKDDRVLKDIQGVVKAAPGCVVKVIIETALLSDEEKVRACRLSMQAGAHYVKTCTGFSGGGATIEDVELMKLAVKNQLFVKASGGIKNEKQAWSLIEAGANRLGTSSGVFIVQGQYAATKAGEY